MTGFNYGIPGLLFPAISLLMLAYTNRFFGLATLVRQLVDKYKKQPDSKIHAQINNLKVRIALIQYSQAMGVLSLLMCTCSMFLLFIEWQYTASILFGCAMIFMLASLILALREIHLSVRALNLEIDEVLDSEKNINRK
ncbi:DUF2721 domain-containing protein [Aquirhabdus sp.]|uniref:DUF2721 domain-containing protein n=1 Tax=Aquirhabdus sp. TaxID=2824160 RepID=UPI00396C9726